MPHGSQQGLYCSVQGTLEILSTLSQHTKRIKRVLLYSVQFNALLNGRPLKAAEANGLKHTMLTGT